jgi:recombination DNA repair RAD52 pathway protein
LLSSEQSAALAAPLNRANVQTRSQAGRSLNYLEGWVAIKEANRIFGFDGWQRETIELRCVAESQRPIGRDQKPGWGVTYSARVRIRLGSQASGAPSLVREGSGAGHGIDVDLGLAHESALKEAETDAMKRALMTFGNPFGLALYDKQQRQITSSVREERAPQGQGPLVQAGHPQQVGETRAISPEMQALTPAQSPAATSDAALAALSPAVIQLLHAQVRSLSRPQLEALVTAFRQRFRLADGASVAAAITQKQHHDWVEAYLVQVEGRQVFQRIG